MVSWRCSEDSYWDIQEPEHKGSEIKEKAHVKQEEDTLTHTRVQLKPVSLNCIVCLPVQSSIKWYLFVWMPVSADIGITVFGIDTLRDLSNRKWMGCIGFNFNFHQCSSTSKRSSSWDTLSKYGKAAIFRCWKSKYFQNKFIFGRLQSRCSQRNYKDHQIIACFPPIFFFRFLSVSASPRLLQYVRSSSVIIIIQWVLHV